MTTQGGIYTINLKREILSLEKLELIGFPQKDFHPHGISLLKVPATAKSTPPTLFVLTVNHRRDADAIEVFEFLPTSKQLKFHYSVTHSLFRNLNDVQGLWTEEGLAFYATNWAYYPFGSFLNVVEVTTNRPWTSVVFCSGSALSIRCKEAVPPGKLRMANGISISPDQRNLYVITSRSKELQVYNRDQFSDLTLNTTVPLGSNCDNLDVTPQGDIYTGCHPSNFKFLKHKVLHTTCPSQVFQIRPINAARGDYKVTELFQSNTNFSGSSTAVTYQDKLLIGGVFDDGVLVCKGVMPSA